MYIYICIYTYIYIYVNIHSRLVAGVYAYDLMISQFTCVPKS